MLTRVDVLVVGLGPAGASAALAAAAAGAKVLAVDRRARPGIPVQCAELVADPVIALCPEARASIVQRIMGLDSRHGTATVTAPFAGWMLDRAALDRALAAAATAEGATVRFGCSALPAADGTVRMSDGQIVRAAAIVAADGPASALARAAGADRPTLLHARQLRVRLSRPLGRASILLRPRFGGGYGWLFARADEANLGLGLETAARRSLPGRLRAVAAALQRRGVIGALGASTGGAIPVGGMRDAARRLGGTPVLLAGDAAALTHPISGAGIAAALESGRLAGEAAAAVAAGYARAADDYAEELRDVFGPAHERALARRARRLAGGALRPTWIGFPEYWDQAA